MIKKYICLFLLLTMGNMVYDWLFSELGQRTVDFEGEIIVAMTLNYLFMECYYKPNEHKS